MAVFLLPLALWVWNCCRQTGYPVTDSRQIRLLRPVFDQLALGRTEEAPKKAPSPHDIVEAGKHPNKEEAPPKKAQAPREGMGKDRAKRRQPYSKVPKEVFRGLYPPFLWLAAIGVVVWWRKKKWS